MKDVPSWRRYITTAHSTIIRPERYVAATAEGVFVEGGITAGNAKAQEALHWAAMWAEALKTVPETSTVTP